jgi:RNA polymerase sigma-70 factor (ECF subfamily)
VATNLSIDLLRRRRTRGYEGPWLPSPVETDPDAVSAESDGGVEARVALRQEVSFAFLLALERLSPRQRAVLVLRDVLGYSGPEVAQILDISTQNVRSMVHRARRALRADPSPPDVTAQHVDRNRAALQRFMFALTSADPQVLQACLTEDVRAITDGGGEFSAARKIVVGADRVVRLLLGLAAKGPQEYEVFERMLNGEPALLFEFGDWGPRMPRRMIMRVDVAADGRVRAVHVISATRKLTAVR